MTGPDATEGDGWTPEFPGQRPPFQPGNEHAFAPGNETAITHGATSERRVGPLAARLAQELLEDADTPDHLREPMFAASVHAWARAEAVCRLLWAWLEGRDIMAGLTAAATTTEEETHSKGKTNRKSVTRSVPAVMDMLRRYEVHAANLRSRLGLDPASAARVGRDLALTRHMNATPLDGALAAIQERRQRALEAGDSSD